jgi:flagellar hook assembly protein FlgD
MKGFREEGRKRGRAHFLIFFSLHHSFIILTGLFLVSIQVPGWAQKQSFVKSYGGSADETGLLVVPREGDGFFIAAYIESVPGFGAAWMIRTDEFGETLWTRTIVDSGETVIFRGAVGDGEGGVILAGQKRTGRGDWDMVAVRIDSAGDKVWQTTSGSSSDDIATNISAVRDGWLMVGNTLQTGGYDVRLVKLDQSGNQVWSRVIGGSQNDLAYGIARTEDFGAVIAGTTYPPNSRFSDILLFKVNYWGEVVWWRQFGGLFWDEAQAVIQTPDSGFAIAGFSSSYGEDMDGFLLRTDFNGDTLWLRSYTLPGFQRFYGLVQTGADGFVLVGEDIQTGEEANLLLLRTDAVGQLVWHRCYGGEGYECGRTIIQLADGGLVSTGRTWTGPVNRFDVYLVRTDSLGQIGMRTGQRIGRVGQGIRFFPNPFSNRVRVETGVGPGVARIFSQNGTVIRILSSGEPNHQFIWDGCDFNGRQVPPGVYILSICGQHQVKLVKCD